MNFINVVDADDIANPHLAQLLPIIHMLLLRGYSRQLFNLFRKFLRIRFVEVLNCWLFILLCLSLHYYGLGSLKLRRLLLSTSD